jgi:predicted transcriptional regulator
MARITKTNFKKAMEGSAGILANIARKLNVSRSAVTQFVQNNPDIQEMLKEEEESINDLAEAKLIQKLNEADIHAIKFRLTTKAKNRGYIEKQEIDLNLTPVTVSFNDPENPYPRIKESKPDMDK